jgi:hypothetical protein
MSDKYSELESEFRDLPKPILKRIQSGESPVLLDDQGQMMVHLPVYFLADLNRRLQQLETALKRAKQRAKR